jgi:hypothetical protein
MNDKAKASSSNQVNEEVCKFIQDFLAKASAL